MGSVRFFRSYEMLVGESMEVAFLFPFVTLVLQRIQGTKGELAGWLSHGEVVLRICCRPRGFLAFRFDIEK